MEFPRMTKEEYQNTIDGLMDIAKLLAKSDLKKSIEMRHHIRKLEMHVMALEPESDVLETFIMD